MRTTFAKGSAHGTFLTDASPMTQDGTQNTPNSPTQHQAHLTHVVRPVNLLPLCYTPNTSGSRRPLTLFKALAHLRVGTSRCPKSTHQSIHSPRRRAVHPSWWSSSARALQVEENPKGGGFGVTPAVLSTAGAKLTLGRLREVHGNDDGFLGRVFDLWVGDPDWR